MLLQSEDDDDDDVNDYDDVPGRHERTNERPSDRLIEEKNF